MRHFLALVSVAAIVATAACNREEAPPPPPPANGAAANEASQNTVAANVTDSIRTRRTHYKEIGKAMGGISDELKAGNPSVAAIQGHAERMRNFAPQIEGWFPTGSGAEAGLKTRAKNEIWSDPAGFQRAAQGFVTATERFHAVAQGGDVEAIRAAVPALGASCKTCHDAYRGPDDD